MFMEIDAGNMYMYTCWYMDTHIHVHVCMYIYACIQRYVRYCMQTCADMCRYTWPSFPYRNAGV